MIDPGIKVDEEYAVYQSGVQGDHFIWRSANQIALSEPTKDAKERLAIGRVWPGNCAFPDFTRHVTRDWWAQLYIPFLTNNFIDGIWFV